RRAEDRSAPGLNDELPPDMATTVISLHELGHLVAKNEGLPPGLYELVVGYKFGPSRLIEGERKYSAMAITFGGLGLRKAKEANPMTIEVGIAAKKKRVAASKPATKSSR